MIVALLSHTNPRLSTLVDLIHFYYNIPHSSRDKIASQQSL